VTALSLPRPFASRSGVPIVAAVDPRIFTRRYFTHCLSCAFCHDACCTYGVDFDHRTHATLERHAAAFEAFSAIPRARWFADESTPDDTMPGGASVRTRVEDGACVFRNRQGRGCLLHGFALAEGIDYHDIKPIVDCLFPLTWEEDVLVPSAEVLDDTLICLDTGPTLYEGVREELRYYFGDELVDALDRMAREVTGIPAR
jgi:hypothetical protein